MPLESLYVHLLVSLRQLLHGKWTIPAKGLSGYLIPQSLVELDGMVLGINAAEQAPLPVQPPPSAKG